MIDLPNEILMMIARIILHSKKEMTHNTLKTSVKITDIISASQSVDYGFKYPYRCFALNRVFIWETLIIQNNLEGAVRFGRILVTAQQYGLGFVDEFRDYMIFSWMIDSSGSLHYNKSVQDTLFDILSKTKLNKLGIHNYNIPSRCLRKFNNYLPGFLLIVIE